MRSHVSEGLDGCREIVVRMGNNLTWVYQEDRLNRNGDKQRPKYLDEVGTSTKIYFVEFFFK